LPYKPLSPCRYPGCPNLGDGAYCEKHRKQVNREYNANIRDKEAQAFYESPEWRKLRKLKLQQTPYCEECYRNGHMTAAQMCDHILPIREYPSRRLDITNLQSLCNSCHRAKTNREQRR
jgi:5-methylcytosine-specific restriction protein A